MGNTYDRVQENTKVAKMRERIMILSEYRDVLDIHQPNFRYFFIVKPTNEQNGGRADWEGRIAAIKQEVTRSVNDMKKDVNLQMNKFENQIEKLADKNKNETNVIRRDVGRLRNDFKSGFAKIDDMQDMIKELRDGLKHKMAPKVAELQKMKSFAGFTARRSTVESRGTSGSPNPKGKKAVRNQSIASKGKY